MSGHGHGTSFRHRLPDRSGKDHYSRSSSKTFLSQSSSFTRRYADRAAVLANIDHLLEGLHKTPVKQPPTENSGENMVTRGADHEGDSVLVRRNEQVGHPSVGGAYNVDGLRNHLQHPLDHLSMNEPDEAREGRPRQLSSGSATVDLEALQQQPVVDRQISSQHSTFSVGQISTEGYILATFEVEGDTVSGKLSGSPNQIESGIEVGDDNSHLVQEEPSACFLTKEAEEVDETVNRPSQATSILLQTTKLLVSGGGNTIVVTSKASSSTDLQTLKVQMPCRLPVAGQAAPPAMGHEEQRAESFRGSPSSSDDVLPQGHLGKHFPQIKQHMTASPRAKVVRMGLREGMNLSQQQPQGQVLSRGGQYEEVPPVHSIGAFNTADSASSIISNSTLTSIVSPTGRFQGMLEGQALLSVKTKTPLSPTRPPSQHAVLPGPRPSDTSEHSIKGGLASIRRPAASAPTSTSGWGLLPHASQDRQALNGSGRPHSPSVTSSVDRILVQHILTRRQQQEGGGQSTKGQQRPSKSQAFLLTGSAEPRRRSTSPGKWR